MKTIISTSLLLSLLLTTSSLENLVASTTSSEEASAPWASSGGEGVERWCDSKCEVRCKVAGMHDRCLNYCGICCRDCKCVPSGTSGNKHECPCYRDKLSSKGTPKCP